MIPRPPMNEARRIVESAAHEHRLPVAELIGPGQDRHLCRVRAGAMAQLRRQGCFVEMIGELVGRHHSTVIYWLRRVDDYATR